MQDHVQSSLYRVVACAVGMAVSFQVLNSVAVPKNIVEPVKRAYWTSSAIAVFHAMVIFFGAVQALCGEASIWGNYDVPAPVYGSFIELSTGYFLYDFILIISGTLGPIDKTMIVHHIMTVTTHYYCVCICRYSAGISAVAFLAEFSTPFCTGRWMLKEAGYTGSIYVFNGAMMAISFFFSRICNGTFLLYLIYVAHPAATGVSLGEGMGGGMGYLFGPMAIAFFGLNVFWFRLIVKGLLKAVLPSKKKE